jgi:hypothetical protein
MARDQGEQGHVVTVVGQEGQSVLVAIPMAGFPEGFQLAPGARVVLVRTRSGLAARPLSRAVRVRVPPEVLERRAGANLVDGKELQEATVVGEQPPVEGAPDEDLVWVVDSGDTEGPQQVIAIRRANPERR